MGGGNNPQINNNGNYNNINNYNNNDQKVTLYLGDIPVEVNDSDVASYSVLQYFTDPELNIGTTNNDYIQIMKELKDNIIEFQNNNDGVYKSNHNMMHLFALIFKEIVSNIPEQGLSKENREKLSYFMDYYSRVINSNTINEEQLNKMCQQFANIINNKYDTGFEAEFKYEYNNYQAKVNEAIKTGQPLFEEYRKQCNKFIQHAIDEYNKKPHNRLIRTAELEDSIKKAREKGLAEGEHNAKIKIARTMLSKGLNIELVSQCTGLSIEKINKINLQK